MPYYKPLKSPAIPQKQHAVENVTGHPKQSHKALNTGGKKQYIAKGGTSSHLVITAITNPSNTPSGLF
jgi:hypothetical protein